MHTASRMSMLPCMAAATGSAVLPGMARLGLRAAAESRVSDVQFGLRILLCGRQMRAWDRRVRKIGEQLLGCPVTAATTIPSDPDAALPSLPLLSLRPGPLTVAQHQQFVTEGFVNAGHIFDNETIGALSEELDRVLAIGSDGRHGAVSFTPFGSQERPVIQIVNMWEASRTFAEVMSHPKVIEIVRQLIGCDDILVWHDQMQYKPPYHGGVTGWHQDSPAWPIILPNNMLSAWLPLDDATIENVRRTYGCMWMVPGSHQWGDEDPWKDGKGGTRGIPADGISGSLEDIGSLNRDGTFQPPSDAPIQELRAVPRPVLKGECHFHHGLMWHASPKNISPHGRRGYAIHYMRADTKYFKAGDHLCKQFVPEDLCDGAPCTEMGDHFPWVCRGGVPVVSSPPRTPNANSPQFNGEVEIDSFNTTQGKRAARKWKSQQRQ